MKLNELVPVTGDGYVIYPTMEVYVAVPFSVDRLYRDTVYCVTGDKERRGEYYATMDSSRYFDGEYWQDGNTEHVSRLFKEKQACLDFVAGIRNKA